VKRGASPRPSGDVLGGVMEDEKAENAAASNGAVEKVPQLQ